VRVAESKAAFSEAVLRAVGRPHDHRVGGREAPNPTSATLSPRARESNTGAQGACASIKDWTSTALPSNSDAVGGFVLETPNAGEDCIHHYGVTTDEQGTANGIAWFDSVELGVNGPAQSCLPYGGSNQLKPTQTQTGARASRRGSTACAAAPRGARPTTRRAPQVPPQ
jgi:hypothetical protein